MKAFFNYIFWIIGLYAFASGCDYPTQMDEVVKTNPALLPNEEESIILQLSDNETFLIDQFKMLLLFLIC